MHYSISRNIQLREFFINYVFKTLTQCTYNKIHVFIIIISPTCSALTAPSFWGTFLYAQNCYIL